MPPIVGAIGLLSHLVAAIAFTVLAVALLGHRRPTGFRLAVALASLITAFWAALTVIAIQYGQPASDWTSQASTLRITAWIGVLLILQRRGWGLDDRASSAFIVATVIGFVTALQFALDIVFEVGTPGSLPPGSPVTILFMVSRLFVSISGLVLLHNLYVNSNQHGGFAFRLFAVGLGVLFAYDLNIYTLHFLLGHPNVQLLEIRGAVNALATPLIYIGVRRERGGRFFLSRKVAFHTVSFAVIGAYLILMSLLAYGLRLTGGDWGELLQITFLVTTMVGGVLVLLSPRFRAEMKVRISRNFYRYRYDYRVEWLRFIDTIDSAASQAQGQIPFRERLIEAMAAVLDSPGGILLEPADGGGFAKTANWRWSMHELPVIAEGAAITLFLTETKRIVDFDQLRVEQGRGRTYGSHGTLTLPKWAAADRAIWLGVPLIHREQLTGIVLLKRSLAQRELNWEDYDLLRTLGRQAASYLAEAETQTQLEEARRFDEFNRRFAFVMHDLKNVVSQLALLARNAERHADKPEFRADMVVTLNSSVTKMSDLLKLMGQKSRKEEAEASGDCDVARLTNMVAATLRRHHGAIDVQGADEPVLVSGDHGRLEAMLTHLVQNAIDASTPEAPIRLSLEQTTRFVRIIVQDHGHGMSPNFIRDELFKPFRSTKNDGFGIGAYEAREIARTHGGRMDVESRPGYGTRFTVTLPLKIPTGLAVENA